MYGFPRTAVRQPIARRPQYNFDPRAYGTLEWWVNAVQSPSIPTDSPPAITSLRDLSGNGRNLSPFTTTPGYLIADGWAGWPALSLGQAAYTGGMPPITGAAARTMVAVVCPTFQDSVYRTMLSFGSSAANTTVGLGTRQTSNALSLFTNNVELSSATAALLLTRPGVYGMTYDGTTVRLYVDGSLIQTTTVAINTGSGVLGLGYRTGSGDFLGGFLTWDAMIWSGAISGAAMATMAAELRAMYRF